MTLFSYPYLTEKLFLRIAVLASDFQRQRQPACETGAICRAQRQTGGSCLSSAITITSLPNPASSGINIYTGGADLVPNTQRGRRGSITRVRPRSQPGPRVPPVPQHQGWFTSRCPHPLQPPRDRDRDPGAPQLSQPWEKGLGLAQLAVLLRTLTQPQSPGVQIRDLQKIRGLVRTV